MLLKFFKKKNEAVSNAKFETAPNCVVFTSHLLGAKFISHHFNTKVLYASALSVYLTNESASSTSFACLSAFSFLITP